MKSLTCEDVNKSAAPRMKTRRVRFILFTLALACFFGLPANSRAQGAADQLALRAFYVVCPEELACNGYNGTITSSLVVMAGDGSFIWATGNPSDVAPAWSPDGTRIAFGRDGEIMVADFPDGIPVNLTNHPADDVGATWSPDGSKIAFATNRDGQVEIYVMNADGTGTVRLTNSIGVLGEPAWSPDGTRIAFDCEVESGNQDICAVNVDGSGFVRLTSHPAVDSGPAWSPNGAKIVFATARYSADPTAFDAMQIAMMNNDGSGTIQIGPSGTVGWDPSFSPDGGRIVFTTSYGCSQPIWVCVYVVNVDGWGEGWLADGETAALRPAAPAPVVLHMHVGDLDRTTLKQGNTWTASVTVTIHDSSENGVSNALVEGFWNTGSTSSCTTDSSGKCTVSKSGIPRNTASVSFTVGNVTHATLTYNTADNHDPDGDSSGTIIAVDRP